MAISHQYSYQLQTGQRYYLNNAYAEKMILRISASNQIFMILFKIKNCKKERKLINNRGFA